MTNRRSLATHEARASRAFQFVPGHVGGRVASAQPVPRRNVTTLSGRATAGADPLALPFPSQITARYDNDWPGGSYTSRNLVPQINVGSSYFGLMIVDGVVGTSSQPQAPTGWRTLATGLSGGNYWGAFALDKAVGGEGIASTWSTGVSAWGMFSLELTYAPTDPVGSWSISVGAKYTGSPGIMTYTPVDAAARVWAQMAVCDRHYGPHLTASADYTAYGKQGVDTPNSGSVSVGTIGGWGANTTQAMSVGFK